MRRVCDAPKDAQADHRVGGGRGNVGGQRRGGGRGGMRKQLPGRARRLVKLQPPCGLAAAVREFVKDSKLRKKCKVQTRLGKRREEDRTHTCRGLVA